MSYVLHIKFGDDPPRVWVCDTLEDASFDLDGFYVANEPLWDVDKETYPNRRIYARIFECKDIDASADLSTEEWKQHIVAEIDAGELERRVLAESDRMTDAGEIRLEEWGWTRVFANIEIPYVGNDGSALC